MAIYTLSGIHISDELFHHGIKGQKWGIRRFQNEDGSYTKAGKERRRSISSSTESGDKSEKIKKAAKIAGAALGAAALGYGAYRLSQSQLGKEFIASQKMRASLAKDASFLSLRKMSIEDLEEKIGRLEKEAKLRQQTFSALTMSADPNKQMLINSGRRVMEAALTGVISYAGYAALSKKFNAQEAARYTFSNPNKKKG